MYIRKGLVIPKFGPNWIQVKGKQVNIPALFRQKWQHKHYFGQIRLIATKLAQFKSYEGLECGNHEKVFKAL